MYVHMYASFLRGVFPFFLIIEEMYPSTLVFEISDSARMRHIVALSRAHASKLRKRVTHAHKLHIYNNHIFVATHLKQ